MATQKVNQAGFHAIGLAFTVLVVAVVALIGLKVFHLHDNSKAAGETPKVASTPSPAPGSQIPAGWSLFTDKKIGAQFLYPNAFGAFTDQTSILGSFPDYESMLISAVPKESGVIGVHGGFTLITYKKDHDEIQTRKYGPKVKLTGGSWIVVEPNPYNPENYKPGDIYTGMKATNVTGLDVYSDQSADEGVFSYSLYFVTNDHLHQLQLPSFDNGAYSSNNFVDQSAYDAMFAQVRDSLALF